jgi:HEAT repeat protein
MRGPVLSVGGLLLGVCVSLCTPMSVRASLGGNAASVQADADAAPATVRLATLNSYDVREIATSDIGRIREFLSRDGTVFAVSWTGPVMPDLKTLLGVHFAPYAAALAGMNQKGLQRFVRVSTANLVVESGGHMRAFTGRAYLPALLPVGVSAADIH